MQRLAHHHHHCRKSSCTSMGSWISDASSSLGSVSVSFAYRDTTQPSPPATVTTRNVICPDLLILGRTSPEIREVCQLLTPPPTPKPNPSQPSPSRTDDNSVGNAIICSAPASLAKCRTMTWTGTDDEPSPVASPMEDLSSSMTSLSFDTTISSFLASPPRPTTQHTSAIKPKVPPAKKFSPKKSLHRRLSFDMLPSPHELSACQGQGGRTGMGMKRTHRRNTTLIIQQR